MLSHGIITASRVSGAFHLPINSRALCSVLPLDKVEQSIEHGFLLPKMSNRILRISTALREKILERDAFMCAYCDGEADCVDHIIPYSYCQDNNQDNLVACCMDCNLIASDHIFESLQAKREYIRHKRGMTKWLKRFANRYSLCSLCRDPYLEGHKNATHFICPRCRMRGWEWKKDVILRLPN